MNINNLIAIVKKKLTDSIVIEKIKIEDKSFLHKTHSGYQESRFHLRIIINSNELKNLSRIESNKKKHHLNIYFSNYLKCICHHLSKK